MKWHAHLSSLSALVILFAAPFLNLYAGFAPLISYQGRLTDSAGDSVPDGVYALKLAIYASEADGSELWSTIGSIPVQVSDGLFTCMLGTQNPLPDSLSDYDSLWLGITVNLDPEISPRTRLASSLFAFKALEAEHADTASHSLDKTISATKLTEGNLSTGRYSAYADLSTEDKIGLGPDQVAPGEHTHNPGDLVVMHDNTWYQVQVSQSMGEVQIHEVTIPAGEVGEMLRVIFSAGSSGGGQAYTFMVRINGSLAYYLQSDGPQYHQLTCVGVGNQNCPCLNLNGSIYSPSTQHIDAISPESPIAISMSVLTSSSTEITFYLKSLLIEYVKP